MDAYQQLKVEKWDHRHWAVYDGPELVCVTVYKKGALEVKRRLEHAVSPGVETAASPAFLTLRWPVGQQPGSLPVSGRDLTPDVDVADIVNDGFGAQVSSGVAGDTR